MLVAVEKTLNMGHELPYRLVHVCLYLYAGEPMYMKTKMHVNISHEHIWMNEKEENQSSLGFSILQITATYYFSHMLSNIHQLMKCNCNAL